MGDKELRRLKRRELLKMLLVQCEETERLQQELHETKRELSDLENGYERLKVKLNIKDERLNQKDAKIAELKEENERIQASREIELNEAGSIAEAALRLNGIFEAAQRSAEQYLINVKRLADQNPQNINMPEEPQTPRIARSAGASQETSARGQKIPFESGWKTVNQRKRLHG